MTSTASRGEARAAAPTEFSGARLELARSFKHVTLQTLATKVSVSFGLLGHYEKGIRKNPSPDLVAALAAALDVQPQFFFEPLADVWTEGECSFRRRVATPEGVKKRARAHGTLIGLVLDLVTSKVKLRPYNVPSIRVRTEDDIEAAAEKCREIWRLGHGPIPHIGRLAEANGIILCQHLRHADKIDAFARRGKYSVIVLNTARTSTSRWIFDVAHEIGHFALHEGAETGSKETERQADAFGSALLLPRRTFTQEFTAKPFSWGHIYDLKRRWLASAGAIIRRAYTLGLIDAIAYRRSYQFMSIKGWLKTELHEPEFVGPEWLPSAFNLVAKQYGWTPSVLCDQLHMMPKLFAEITGLVTAAPGTFKPRLIRG